VRSTTVESSKKAGNTETLFFAEKRKQATKSTVRSSRWPCRARAGAARTVGWSASSSTKPRVAASPKFPPPKPRIPPLNPSRRRCLPIFPSPPPPELRPIWSGGGRRARKHTHLRPIRSSGKLPVPWICLDSCCFALPISPRLVPNP
jgi:hypothetical protein